MRVQGPLRFFEKFFLVLRREKIFQKSLALSKAPSCEGFIVSRRKNIFFKGMVGPGDKEKAKPCRCIYNAD
ncbi:hypothetical protein DCM91_16250 [Chitinophaga costaii]|nr:hypothetical protein DCM91_16250 [Chitinophaga costaii]